MMRDRGFTLVETLVAIAILLVAISAPLLTAERAAAAAYAARDELTAAYLAQEGADYVRAMRDDSWLHDYQTSTDGASLSTAAWNDFLNGALSSSITNCRGRTCSLDPAQPMGYGPGNALTLCPASCGALFLSTGGIYTQQAGQGYTPTTFIRSINVSNNTSQLDAKNNPIGVRVAVTVSWTTDGVPYSITINDNLAPWQ